MLEKGKQAWEKQWKLLQGLREELKAVLRVLLGEKGDRRVCAEQGFEGGQQKGLILHFK